MEAADRDHRTARVTDTVTNLEVTDRSQAAAGPGLTDLPADSEFIRKQKQFRSTMKDLLNDTSLWFYANSIYNGQPILPAG